MYPLYNFSVDSDGMGSAFGPNIIYALSRVSNLGEIPLRQSIPHMIGPIAGGFLGGKIMVAAFPDDSSFSQEKTIGIFDH